MTGTDEENGLLRRGHYRRQRNQLICTKGKFTIYFFSRETLVKEDNAEAE